MKKIIFLGLFVFLVLSSKAILAPVTEYTIVKSGGGIGALFNLYSWVQTDKTLLTYSDGSQGWSIFVDCSGRGFSRCRFTSNIIPPAPNANPNMTPETFGLLQNDAELLNELSEKRASEGQLVGSASSTRAVMENGSFVYYFVKASWTYSESDITSGTVRIMISRSDEII